MSLNSLEDLLTEQLQDLYSAEVQFAEAQPKMAEAASDDALRDALETHLEVTRGQVARLEQVAKVLGVNLQGKTCHAARGLVREGQETVAQEGDPFVKDAALIAAAQRIEHYEIAGYGTVCAFAKRLGYKEAERLLQETLAEERGADMLLNELAEGSINREAAS
ncbi:ferritin-like domain-containing protein [soil metagenome]|jgi:ferritin-like metal-binding protein YciE|nr:ferritin-like domain-containing protein [Deinococcota bacterium]